MKLTDKLPLRNDGYVIVGFARCGQNALEHWLQKRQRNCVKYECMEWGMEGVRSTQRKHASKRPIIIIRDKAERAWSMYFWGSMNVKMSWEKFLHVKSWDYTHVMNPIEFSHYENFIQNWRPLNPIILRFEEIITDSSLPHMNSTADKLGTKKPKLPRGARKLFYEIYAKWCADKTMDDSYMKQFKNFEELLT